VDGTINWRVFGVGAKEEESAYSGAGLGLKEVGCIAVDLEYHVTGLVSDDGVQMGGCIVQQFGTCYCSVCTLRRKRFFVPAMSQCTKTV
jgi:hypothetical protein